MTLRDTIAVASQADSAGVVSARHEPLVERLTEALKTEGIALLPELVSQERLTEMQRAFRARLHRMRWNDFDGYEREVLRYVVQDVLTLDQGFVDIALHPIVTGTVERYMGKNFALVETKGWRSVCTKRDFHGWHGDAWYDQEKSFGIEMEVKLGFYLTDVQSGAFNYIQRTHRQQHPRPVLTSEVKDVPRSQIAEMIGPAGTAFLFDTSGIHRQSLPITEPREAVFYNYHDPNVPLQKESVDYYRYHPLILNAAFLGNLSAADQRILGFGNSVRYQPAHERLNQHKALQNMFRLAHGTSLRISDLRERARIRLNSLLKHE